MGTTKGKGAQTKGLPKVLCVLPKVLSPKTFGSAQTTFGSTHKTFARPLVCAPLALVVPTKPLVANFKYRKRVCAGQGLVPFKKERQLAKEATFAKDYKPQEFRFPGFWSEQFSFPITQELKRERLEEARAAAEAQIEESRGGAGRG